LITTSLDSGPQILKTRCGVHEKIYQVGYSLGARGFVKASKGGIKSSKHNEVRDNHRSGYTLQQKMGT
jgi:hypothetical protein